MYEMPTSWGGTHSNFPSPKSMLIQSLSGAHMNYKYMEETSKVPYAIMPI